MKLSSLILFGLLLASISFASISGDARSTQSEAYWVGEARPFAIIAHSSWGNTLTLVIQNVEETPKTLNSIELSGYVYSNVRGSNVINSSLNVADGYFKPSEVRTINITLPNNCYDGGFYEYSLNSTYSGGENSSGITRFVGSKTLLGKCEFVADLYAQRKNGTLLASAIFIAISIFGLAGAAGGIFFIYVLLTKRPDIIAAFKSGIFSYAALFALGGIVFVFGFFGGENIAFFCAIPAIIILAWIGKKSKDENLDWQSAFFRGALGGAFFSVSFALYLLYALVGGSPANFALSILFFIQTELTGAGLAGIVSALAYKFYEHIGKNQTVKP